MKVLWLCNVMIPSISKDMHEPILPVGGWLDGLSSELVLNSQIELVYCFPHSNSVSGMAGKIKYYGFCNAAIEFRSILENENPNVIHIFGTEFSHTKQMVIIANKFGVLDKVVISIQGLVSVYSRHYSLGIPLRYQYYKTFRDWLKGDSIKKKQKLFEKKGKEEIDAIKLVKNVIGRTEWDYACVKRLNPDAKYFHGGETLRKTFYDVNNRWEYEECSKHSIFVSQNYYPIKGFHFLLEAMSDVIKQYPDAHIFTTGESPFKDSLLKKIRISSYDKYLQDLMIQYGLKNKVTFLGSLSEGEMCNAFRKCNVFVMPSTVENSPNALGEAMILGVPCVVADVGGVTSMIKHGVEGYVYPCDEPYMLAHFIMKVFEDVDTAKMMAQNAIEHAKVNHNAENNTEELLRAYFALCKQEEK